MLATAQCSNSEEMKIRVEVEMTLPQWKNILTLTDPYRKQEVRYYGPLQELRNTVEKAIADIEAKVEVKSEDVKSAKG